jgi:glucosamine kinase
VALFIGVDAGGTRTVAAAAEGEAILARGEAGPGAVRPGQAVVAAAAIAVAARDALQRARRTAPADVLVVGASGAAREPERSELEEAIGMHGLAHRVRVTSDAEIGLRAAFGAGPGVLLIAGTGAVARARFPDGTTDRSGGLGPVLGDQGSAFDVAREALRRAAWAAEQHGDDELLNQILGRLGIGADRLPAWSLAASTAEIAQLAPLVVEAAGRGEATSRTIMARAAADLADTALRLLRRFPRPEAPELAWGGGLLCGAPAYRKEVISRIQSGLTVMIQPGPVDGPAGALAMAREP